MDVGSSFLKLWVMDLEEGKVVFKQICPTPEFSDTTGSKREIPMEKLSDLVQQMLNKALSLYAVEGIAFSVQMHGFELFDHQGAVTDYISWQDMRGNRSDIATQLRNIAGDDLFRRNGIELWNTHSLCPLYHLIQEKKLKGPLDFAMMGDALIRHLTGEVVPIHPTVAASSGLYDLEKNDWNRDLIEILSFDHINFPQVSAGKKPIAYYNYNSRKIPLYIAVGDHQAAVLGCGAIEGDLIINIGTGGQISFVDGELSLASDYETRPYFSGRILRALTQLYSGRALNVLMNLILDVGQKVFCLNQTADSELWARINDLAEEAGNTTSDKKLEMNMSFFNSDGGLIREIDTANLTAGNLFLAAYRGMAECYFNAFQRLGLEGRSLNGIIGTGGVLLKTPLLQRLLAERFGLQLKLSSDSEDVMFGLLRLGQWYMHINSDILPCA